MDLSKLSSYQNPEGQLQDRLAPRTDLRLKLFQPGWFTKKSVLDLGCNNGYFTRFAKKSGATRCVGVDRSNCILGARELAKQENLDVEFWQTDLESIEFKRHCPKFQVVMQLSALTKLKDKDAFLDWLDEHILYMYIFESNHGEENKKHIDLVTKHIHFESVEYLGASEIPSKPHYMWVCRKPSHNIRFGIIASSPFAFVPIDKITGWDEKSIMEQKAAYSLKSEKYLALKEDIKRRGIREPLVVQNRPGGVILGFQGSHRYFAAKELGYKEVPCKVVTYNFKHLGQ